MAIDVSGFTTPEQSFQGLFHLAHDMRDDTARAERTQREERARKATSGKFLTDYLDPTQYLTGTNYDPLRAQKLAEIMNEGVGLINTEGVDNNMLMMALAPKVNRLIQEGETIKAVDAQRKQALSMLKDQKGINQQRFNDAFKDYVFYETDEKTGQKKLKDITQLDPGQNFADEVLRTQDVYDPTGFDEFVQKSGKEARQKSVKMTGAKGGMTAKDIDYTSPSWMQPEEDARGVFTGEFVPEYEVAIRDGKPAMGQFGKTTAPVRMLSKEIWERSLPVSAKAFAIQEAKKAAKEQGIPVSDPRVEDYARAIAYDYAKASGKQFSTFKERVQQKEAPAPRFNINVNTGDNTPVTRDLYNPLKAKVSGKSGYQQVNTLDPGTKKIILAIAKEASGDDTDQSDIRLQIEPSSGEVAIYSADGKEFISFVDEQTLNLYANQVLGTKAKTEVVKGKSKPKPEAEKPTSGGGGWKNRAKPVKQ